MSNIEKFKEQVRAKMEKEIYKSSIPVTVMYTVGDGGEYTKDEADVMAHFYNNDNSINVSWMLDDIKRTYALNSLKEKGILWDPRNERGEWYHFNVDERAIRKTRQNDIPKEPDRKGLTLEEMEYLDSLINDVE